MTALKTNKLNSYESELLTRLAKQNVTLARLEEINGTVIYQITEGWQREVIMNDAATMIINNTTDFESAVQSPEKFVIFVPKEAAITQNIVQRILERNPLPKTVLWEI